MTREAWIGLGILAALIAFSAHLGAFRKPGDWVMLLMIAVFLLVRLVVAWKQRRGRH